MPNIPLFKTYTDADDIKAVSEVIKSGMNWAIGPKVQELEKMVAKYIGRKYAVAVNSGTSALHALMIAYGFGPGDEVIVPSDTFVATANAVVMVGAKPVFAEIEEKHFGIDPALLEKKITKKTKAIMPVHYGGCACQIEAIKKIAKKHKLLLIEDAAQSLGAKIGNKKAGSFGDSAVFSVCGSKVITTGEGGMVLTDNKDIFEKLKLIRSHGRLETENYFSSTKYMDYVMLGYNFRMSNITAALGLAQFKKLGKVIAMRRKNVQYLNKKLSAIDGVVVPEVPSPYFHMYQTYTIILTGGKTVRDALKKHVNANGIFAKVYYDSVHLTSFYQETFGYKKGDLPATEAICDKVLSVPMYPDLTKKEMDYMVAQVKSFFKNV